MPRAGEDPVFSFASSGEQPFLFLPEHADYNWRDVAFLGDCDDGVQALCRELGWQDELEALPNIGTGKS